jgi:hypothetical protein
MLTVNRVVDNLYINDYKPFNRTKNSSNENDRTAIPKISQHEYIQEMQASLVMQAELKKNTRKHKEKCKPVISPIEELLGGTFNGK